MTLRLVTAALLTAGGFSARAESVAEMLKRFSASLERLEKGGGPSFQHISFRSGVAFFEDDSGKSLVAVGRSSQNNGGVWIYGKTAERAAELSVGAKGGYLQFYTAGKTKTAEIGVAPGNGGGAGWFYNAEGKETAFIGTGSSGSGYLSVNGKSVGDYSEVFELANRTGITPGAVVSAAADGRGLVLTQSPYDPAVVGVISGAGRLVQAVQIGTRADGTSDLPVAVAGQVYVRASTENGPIKVGDLLVSSSRPGVAMRASDPARAFGAIIGKALEPYISGQQGLVRMLVMSR